MCIKKLCLYISVMLAASSIGCANASQPATGQSAQTAAMHAPSSSSEAEEAAPSPTAVITSTGQYTAQPGVQETLSDLALSSSDETACLTIPQLSEVHISNSVMTSDAIAVSVSGGAFFAEDSSFTGSFLLNETSIISVKNCQLTATSDGPVFLQESGDASILISECDLSGSEPLLLDLEKGDTSLTLKSQTLSAGFSVADDSCSLSVRLTEGSVLTGTFNPDSLSYVILSIDSESCWELTDDAYIEILDCSAGTIEEILSRIHSNGYTVYYNCENIANDALGARSYSLPGGGTLCPLI